MSIHTLYVLVLCTVSIHHTTSISQHPLILIISFDGFRYNYLDRGLTPNLLQFRKEGVHSDYIHNIFPTKTYPNHHSISTGLYAEQHGVIDNHIFDVKNNKSIGYSEEMFSRSDVMPIYTLNELAGEGRYSGNMMWPGADYAYQGHNITYNHKFERKSLWEERVNEVVTWFTNKEKPANLVMLYFDEPDSQGHMYGPDSQEVNDKIVKCDNIVKYLLNKFSQTGLTDRVNVFIMSDHGMAPVLVKTLININDYVNPAYVQYGGGSPTVEVFPAKNKEEEVYANLTAAATKLKTFKVYRKADMPDRWHYKNSERTPPILVVTEESYAFLDLLQQLSWALHEHGLKLTNNSNVGLHGYDTTVQSMFPLFLANGPLLKKQTKVEPFDSIDLFSLWCHMLKLTPPKPEVAVSSLGVLGHVRGLLVEDEKPSNSFLATVLLLFVIVGAICVILAIYENVGGLALFGAVNTVASSNNQSGTNRRQSSQYRVLPQLPEDSEESDSGLPRVHLIRVDSNTS
ncbi:hypothetical protein M8J75_004224 [Diaphorina citri]|nr:hypothetical protein M8J75_004224 [Diaphorina citri]